MNAPFVTPYDVETIRAEFPILVAAGLWQAARLSRQRRLGAEAARRHRRHGAHHGDRLLERAPRPALHGERRDRGLRGRPRGRAALPQRPLDRRDRVHEIGDRGLQPRRRLLRHAWRSGEGDEIILSIMEHHSNIVPWHFLRERKGAVIKWAPVDDDGNFLLDEFEKLFSPRTKIVAITHMSNVLGTVTPVKRDRAHRPCARRAGAARRHPGRGAPLASTCRSSTADFYVFTGHKVYGPTGIGVLYGKREWLDEDAALPGRRRDDQRGALRGHHLQRAAAPLRGRHAADRRGDRPRGRRALHDGARPRAHPGPRGGALGLCA